MNVLIDENFPKDSAEYLRKNGFEVFDIRGTDMEGLCDADIFNYAKNIEAVFLTTDKDFYHTIHFTHKPHYGIIVIALSQPNAKSILNKVKWILSRFELSDIGNKCLLVTNNRCKIFS